MLVRLPPGCTCQRQAESRFLEETKGVKFGLKKKGREEKVSRTPWGGSRNRRDKRPR